MSRLELACNQRKQIGLQPRLQLEKLGDGVNQNVAPVEPIKVGVGKALHFHQSLIGKFAKHLVCSRMRDISTAGEIATTSAHVPREREQRPEKPDMAGASKYAVESLIQLHWYIRLPGGRYSYHPRLRTDAVTSVMAPRLTRLIPMS